MLSMDFERVLKALLTEFERQQLRYGVIGGFAMGALGVPRATMDFDLLVHRDDLGVLHGLLTSLGYQRRALTENVSHYSHPQDAWGDVDVLHAFRPASLQMLQRSRLVPIFGGTQTIRVLAPEDVIGFKVQAIANNPLRKVQDMADVELLAAAHGGAMDWSRIQEYYDLFDLGEEGRQLKKRFGDAE
ncbi:MAG: nucleotidyltransferase family protein [Candidatus Omnitrophica bacterium]|nr:nucleotidyltransferase family protein [Candidatus Omnitrophota bacterium]